VWSRGSTSRFRSQARSSFGSAERIPRRARAIPRSSRRKASTTSGDDGTKSTDFGIAAGAGVEMAVSDGLWLGVDVIYSLGLTNVDETAAEDIKTRHLAVQAGLVIPFGG